LLAAWAVSYAAKAGSLRWLLISAVLVGLGFNINMLQAYLVVPALGLVYLLGTPLSWQKRIQHLALALLVILVISFSWIAVVDLTPASQRPYVGSSGTNSEMGLVFGSNGLQRLFGISAPESGQPNGGGSANASNATSTSAVFTQGESGSPSLFRLFNEYLGGLVGWFLPMALLGFLFVVWQKWWHRPSRPSKLEPLTPHQQGLVLWGVWLLTVGLFLSIAEVISPYYTVLLVPAVAAFFGIGMVAFWQAYRQPSWEGWLLPCALFINAVVQALLLRPYSEESIVLTPVVMGLTLIAVVGLVCKRILQFMAVRQLQDEFENVENKVVTTSDFAATRCRFIVPFVTIGVIALLIVPALWDSSVMLADNSAPDADATSGGSGASSHTSFNETVNQLERFLISNQGRAQFILATPSAMIAAPLILDTDKAVMALGGFSGADRILTSQQLAVLVKRGVVRFFLLSSGYSDRNRDLVQWVKGNCAAVPPSRWLSSSAGTSGNFPDFFDCAGA
jgi:4-amino-4-deoxy-L-arabinose transferase-like glycosyltransferase